MAIPARGGQLLPAHSLHFIHDLKHLPMNLHHTGTSLPQLLVPSDLLLGLYEKPGWDRSQLRFAFLTGTDNHAGVELALSALAAWLSTFSLELIDAAFQDRPIGKKGLDKPFHLVGELKKGLSKATEFFFCSVILHAHCY
jgi:hypothetical protein